MDEHDQGYPFPFKSTTVMKNSKLLVILILHCSILVSCKKPMDLTNSPEVEIIDEDPKKQIDSHNSMTSLDWNGTYKGILPCASCEGIETTLTLNSDYSYVLVTSYLGRNDALEEEKRGKFSWNEEGSIITLINVTSGPNQYKVGENRIWHLDIDGKMIDGDLADHYVLTKAP